MKVVVVGASSGLGRCIARGLGERGAELALMARSVDKLADAAKEAGPGTVTVRCDVTDAASCREAIDEAVAALGGLDALIYTPAIGPLVKLADTDVDTWRQVFDTNVIGASMITAAAVPHLEQSRGVAAYLSSNSASRTAPWPGLGAYIVSKAALEKLIEAWRNEHPQIGFTRVTVGECAGGEGDAVTHFNDGWDRELAAEVVPTWINRHYISGGLLEVEELVKVVDAVVRCGASASIPEVTVVPRPPA